MQQKQNNKNSRKYLLSLLYTLKDLLFLILKSGFIGALIVNILMYAVFKESFDAIGCLAYIICGGSIGIVIGYIIKAVRGQDEGDTFANATGDTMYNMYAGVHNLRVLSGSTIGSGMSILGLFFTVVIYAFIFDLFAAIDTCVNRISRYNVRYRSNNTWDTRNTRMHTG